MEKNLMKWYLIRHEINPKVVGNIKARQSLKMTGGYDYSAENSVYNIATKEFSDSDFIKINFDKIELESGAKYTDLISSMVINSFYVLIISSSLTQFLNKFKLPQKYIKEVKVVNPRLNIEIDYNAFYINNNYEIIDFLETEFIIKETFQPWETGEIRKFKNQIELNEFFKKMTGEISIKPVFLKLRTDFELFRLAKLGGFFVSENLKRDIEHQNFTGISFELSENISVEVI